MRAIYYLTLLCCATLWAQAPVPFFPIKDVRPGMQGIGRTVFNGSKIEEFQVEILGVLENSGPRQSIILAKLSGGPLDKTGVMQGMSGSPVYINGKLLGAVALGFAFSKDAIAGIRPIGEMVEARTSGKAQVRPGRSHDAPGGNAPVEMMTPFSFSGFSQGTIQAFAPQLRSLGFEPQQAISVGRQPPAERKPSEPLLPGSMISVQLLNGDMSVGADGTVTHIDGKRLYAFGHRFLAVGATDLPFAKSSVVALLPNVNTSFKIASSGDWMGSITTDTSTAVSGELGRRPSMVPLTISVDGAKNMAYRMEMVRDRFLSPMLLQMALYSALDATERTLGSGSVAVSAKVRFEGVKDPVVIENIHSGDFNVPLQASMGTVMPIAFALQNSLDELRLASVEITLHTFAQKKQWTVDQVWPSRRDARPGDPVDIAVVLLDDDGHEVRRNIRYDVPVGAPLGPLYFTVGDAATINASEQKFLAVTEPRPSSQIIQAINSFRGNKQGYVRVWRSDASYNVSGRELQSPPPSLGLILSRTVTPTAASVPRTSTIAELTFPAADCAVTGSKTIQVDIKE